MTQLEKIARARMYLDMLARGIDPLTGMPVCEQDVVRKERIIRCFDYVSDLLSQLLKMEECGAQPMESEPVHQPTPTTKSQAYHRPPFALTPQQREALYPCDKPLTISELARWITSFSGVAHMKPLPYRKISQWLTEIGLLEIRENQNGNQRSYVTEKGKQFGIFLEERTSPNGIYFSTLYPPAVQQFIINNLEAVISCVPEKRKRKSSADESIGESGWIDIN